MATLLISFPVSAHAAPGKAIEVELRQIRSGSILEGTIAFSAAASSAAGIEKLELWINDQMVDSLEPDNVRQNVDLPYSWITSMIPETADLAPNGEYAVTARAIANGGADATTVAKVVVDNPAATPVGVGVAETPSGVRLTWEPNPEPDLLGYQIERSSGAGWELLTQTIETTILDPVEDGEYSYRVIAVRSSAARSTGRPSLPSEAVSISLVAAGSAGEGSVTGRGADLAQRNQAFITAGLPAPAGLPGAPALPGSGGRGQKLGSYQRRLPYPEGGVPLSAEQRGDSGWDLMPADGLRWVAAGSLLIALAALLRLVAKRLEAVAAPPPLKL
jgi:hypothetical protein